MLIFSWLIIFLLFLCPPNNSMLQHSRAIVLKSIKYGETSLIVHLLTESFGRRHIIVNGVRKSKSSQPYILFQPGSIIELQLYFQENKQLLRAKDIKFAYQFTHVELDIRRTAIRSFMVELVEKTIRDHEIGSLHFALLFEYLKWIDQVDAPLTHLSGHFMLQLSSCLGFMPHGEWSEQSPYFNFKEGIFTQTDVVNSSIDSECSKYLYQLISIPIPEWDNLIVSSAVRRKFIVEMIQFFKYHNESMGTIHSHEIFKIIFEA